jgi:hypothetical protein
MSTPELKDLVGMRKFSGFDRRTETVKDECGEHADSEVCLFVLDGVTYRAEEDPEDGYRTSMKPLAFTNEEVKNSFDPVDVFCVHRTTGEYSDVDDILQIMNLKADIILEIGTENIDDYYPVFVSKFSAENIGEVA